MRFMKRTKANKKVMIFLTGMFLSLFLTGCSMKKTTFFPGYWTVVAVKSSAAVGKADATGEEIFIDMNAKSNKVVMNLGDGEESGTWSQEKDIATIKKDTGEEIPVSINEEGYLCMGTDGKTYIFKRKMKTPVNGIKQKFQKLLPGNALN